MNVTEWISYHEAEDREENGIGGLGGFFENGMRWGDYITRYKEEYRGEVEALRSSIIENGIKCTGSDHQYENGYVPLWENGTVDTFSMRAWGDLMAAVWSTEENKDYSYMDFYC